MYYVYVLRSLVNGKFYTGYTGNFDRRLKEHNAGRGGRFTKLNKPFELVYREEFDDEYVAKKRERELKTSKGRYFVKKIVRLTTK
ncbi:MAG: GIY-YIG nuclease family protein [Candidatus Shapirobacteria bacterium]|jgi:putative endonuclease